MVIQLGLGWLRHVLRHAFSLATAGVCAGLSGCA